MPNGADIGDSQTNRFTNKQGEISAGFEICARHIFSIDMNAPGKNA
jgi:hypothetical protein